MEMSQQLTANEILDFAIEREQEAVDFYTDLAQKVKAAAMRDVFVQFAKEERGHKAKLEGVKIGKKLLGGSGAVLDLKIADYLVAEEPGPDLDYQGALILAMKKEKAAFKLYTNLAERTGDPALRELFLGLAQEEAKHKLRFELEYDDNVLKDN
jgi:rubrerythrin